MKTILLLCLLLALPAAAQYTTNDGRPITGMSFDPPPAKSLPVLRIAMQDVPADSPKFQKILASVRLRYPGLTQDAFIAALQNGKVFTVTAPVKQTKCAPCRGWGKIYDANSKVPDKKPACQSCKGTGKSPATQTCHIVWKP